MFRQAQPDTQQAGMQAYQPAVSRDFEAAYQQEHYAQAAASVLGVKPVRGRMLTFVSEGGFATLSSSVPSDNPAQHTHLQPGVASPGMSLHADFWKSGSTGLCNTVELQLHLLCLWICSTHLSISSITIT